MNLSYPVKHGLTSLVNWCAQSIGSFRFSCGVLVIQNIPKTIIVATVFGIPLAWFGMAQWLEGFAYHIHWSIFLFAFLASLFDAWLTVSYKSIKTAIANPAESLRNE